MVEMDTTEYWSAFVVPRITLNPEDSVATGIKEFEDKVKDYELQTYPNPFNAAVTISIGVGSGTTYHRPQTIYQIEILDINGRMVADISVGDVRERPDDGRFTNRPYEITWTPEESITSSVYLIRATAGDKSVTKRIVYLR
ncbi:hypothetical protein DRQ36_04620 [bacterium]|nr:MAG: hypothetical protein DRQ36_04620 [bacterium]